MTEKQKEQLKLRTRMWDLGHAPKERVINRVFETASKEEGQPSDERLHELLADENTREDIQDIYG